MTAAEDALRQGLEVWLSPDMFEQSQERTLKYIARAAAAAEQLRQSWPVRLVLGLGSESTLFTQGIVEGRSLTQRLSHPTLRETVETGRHNGPLNAFLARANEAARQVFHGKVTYASLVWEPVDWSLFDFVGVDHYRDARIKDRDVDMLWPLLGHGKPDTEFGCRTHRGAEDSGAMGLGIIDWKRMGFRWLLQHIPVLGQSVRLELNGDSVRDEALQAREIVETLAVLDAVGVDGAFVQTFVEPFMTYSEHPKYDLDMGGFGLVKSYAGQHGTTYPDMPWEPKESFRAVADYFASHQPGT